MFDSVPNTPLNGYNTETTGVLVNELTYKAKFIFCKDNSLRAGAH